MRLARQSGPTGEISKKSHGTSRIPSREKTEAVLRVLRGEDLHLVARELNVSTSKIEEWKETFIAAGRDKLREHSKKRQRFRWLKGRQTVVIQWLLLFVALFYFVRFLLHMTTATPPDATP
jgi:hypothetical protein